MTGHAPKERPVGLCAIGQICPRDRTDNRGINRDTNAAVLGIGVVAALPLAFLTCGGNLMPRGETMSWWR
jgi:hypothetical protein